MCRNPNHFASCLARLWSPLSSIFGFGVAGAVWCFGSFLPATAQVTITNAPPTNHISGEGLSPSHFIPPSQPTTPPLDSGLPLGLVPPPAKTQPLAPTPPSKDSQLHSPPSSLAPSLFGSGVPSPPQFPSVVGSLPSIPSIPNPEIPLGEIPLGEISTPLSDWSDSPQSIQAAQPNTSINLDLRSASAKGVSSSLDSQSHQPLSNPSPWFFSSNALIYNLRPGSSRLYSSAASDPELGTLDSQSVRMPSTGGYEIGIGRYFGCGKYALQANYWGVSPAVSRASIDDSTFGPLATNLPFNLPSSSVSGKIEGLYLGATPMSEAFRGASEHRLESQREFNNLELNLYWFATGGSARQPIAPRFDDSRCWTLSDQPTGPTAPWFQTPSRLHLSLYSGARWFQFQDLIDYRANDAYFQSDVRNDLWGFQTGALSHWAMTPRWSLWGNINGGLYNNHGKMRTNAGNQAGLATIVSPGASNGALYDFDVSGNSTAFLGETSTGLGWHFARGWTANLGYRVIGVSGVGTAESQIPGDVRVSSQSSRIQSSDSLILHGFTLGATYNF